ncbi:hypothetical protein McanMca71_003090 [Microsporum canis]|uniref:Uncharacterized protein n=1 Tax=Arthroderma otae (strain ATCC MYA-4605 / CBS 113480) TaxID=554155 RepID=C5G041_ARTOC|nr:uncharacterized protein MCYG_08313 [Microsporum canis CBS 113480]EEQ35494.1 predicted protein [Microsporum canis CBS 113480]
MAKQREALSLGTMERMLGYKVAVLDGPDERQQWFYSDLTPVPETVYERTRKELDDYQKRNEILDHKGLSRKNNFPPSFTKAIEHGQDVIHIERKGILGLYSFTAYIQYGFGFDLALVLTESEALKFRNTASNNAGKSLTPILPQELRDIIYDFSLPYGKWQKHDADNEFDTSTFLTGLGDPSGFYFPLSNSLAILAVNKQIRTEALPLAYQNTLFHLDDIDDFLRFGMAIGSIGRENVRSLEFAWESRADFSTQSPSDSGEEELLGRLPLIHASRCVKLLKEFTKLRILRLWFDSDILNYLPLKNFKTDLGICGLCSLRGMERVDILGLDIDPTACPIAKWLKDTLESS